MMKNGLAYGIMAGQGRKALALLCLAGLAGCAAPDTQHPTKFVSVDGVPMKVYYADNVLDYVEIVDRNRATGEGVQIMPIPLTSGYAVMRNDGKPTTETDEGRAQEAAQHFCAAEGKAPGKLRLNGLQGGTAHVWYFGGCA